MPTQLQRAAVSAAGLALVLMSQSFAADVQHIVQSGENPWSISARYLRSMDLWPRLVKYNRVADSHRIAPGTVLRIPEGWLARRSVPASVLAVNGEVSMTDARGRQSRLKPGDRLTEGAILRTGADDSLSLGLLDHSRVLVRSDSEVRLQSNAQIARERTRSILLDLRHGALENDVEKRSSSGGRFEIRTPAGVAAVRGTTFRVGASESKTLTEVLGGAVKLQSGASAVDVAAGFGTSVEPNRRPEPPRPLLPAPDLAGLPQRIERVPCDLPIPPLAGATGYRTQIAIDEAFTSLLFEQTAELPVARVRDLPDGEYQLRVRGIDAAGFEGFDAARRLVIDARPEAPFLISPIDQAKTGEVRPAFRWTTRDGAFTYRFQLARDAAFADLLVDRSDVSGDGIRIETDLPPGEYFWRVATIEAGQDIGPFSEVQRLRRLPGTPDVDVQSGKDGKPAIRWRPAGPDERFQLQIARDASFTAPLVDLTLAKPDTELPSLEAGKYHLRARTIAGDGYVGDWGAVQQFEIRSRLSPGLLLLLVPVLLGL